MIVEEFIENCYKINLGDATRDTVSMRNSLSTYKVPVQMMSAIYKSLAQRRSASNALISNQL